MKIMFICTGNICRSAMAHAMLEQRAKQQNKDIQVYSCGVFADDGAKATDEAIEAIGEYGINLKEHRATNIRNSKIGEMDIILCATQNHKKMVEQMYPDIAKKIFTMKEYIKKEGNLDIKDPWGYDLATYRKCASEIEEVVNYILKS